MLVEDMTLTTWSWMTYFSQTTWNWMTYFSQSTKLKRLGAMGVAAQGKREVQLPFSTRPVRSAAVGKAEGTSPPEVLLEVRATLAASTPWAPAVGTFPVPLGYHARKIPSDGFSLLRCPRACPVQPFIKSSQGQAGMVGRRPGRGVEEREERQERGCGLQDAKADNEGKEPRDYDVRSPGRGGVGRGGAGLKASLMVPWATWPAKRKHCVCCTVLAKDTCFL